MSLLERARLEKAAADCGFERSPEVSDDGVLVFRSALFPEFVSVRSLGASGYGVFVSEPALLSDGVGSETIVDGIEQLYAVLQHAAAVARTMPNRVADQFLSQTRLLPKSTEAERLVVQRVGQNLFRDALLDYWHGSCCVTGLSVASLLRASHIKPWAKCENDNERLDVFNGLLLAPHIDALFDDGWISFSDQGGVLVSKTLPTVARTQLDLSTDWCIKGLRPEHMHYLGFHRATVFRRCS